MRSSKLMSDSASTQCWSVFIRRAVERSYSSSVRQQRHFSDCGMTSWTTSLSIARHGAKGSILPTFISKFRCILSPCNLWERKLFISWAAMWENVPSDMNAQQRFRSACALTQSGQSSLDAFWMAKDAVSSCWTRRHWSDCTAAKPDLSIGAICQRLRVSRYGLFLHDSCTLR